MADPVPLQIINAIKTRLEAINSADGYNTDAGGSVEIGISTVNPDELACGCVLRVYEIADQPSEDETLGGITVIILNVVVEALTRLGPESSPEALAYLWQDVHRALFQTDTTLGGLALAVLRGPREFHYPPAGGETVAVRQAVNIHYLETYGQP